ARLCPFHIFADRADLAGIQRITGQCPLLEELTQPLAVQRVVHRLVEPGTYLWLVTVADGLQYQFAQGLVLEAHPAEHVEDLTSQRLAFFLQLLKESLEDLALARLTGNQVPEVADLRLPDTVNAPEALFQPVGIPG